MKVKPCLLSILLALLLQAHVADTVAAQGIQDSLIVVVAHEAAEAGPIRVSFGDNTLVVDSLQYGEFADAVLYFDVSGQELYFYLYDYELAAELVYSVNTAEIIAVGNIFTLVIPAQSAGWLDAVFDNGTTVQLGLTIVEAIEPDEPRIITSEINTYPNPATARVRIEFDVISPANIAVEVFDLLGRALVTDELWATPGTNEHTVDFAGLAAGTYFVRLTARNNQSEIARTTKLVVGS